MRIHSNSEHEFWITNISRTLDVSLRDLRLTVRAGRSMNLLGKNHHYTLEQLQASATNGSLFNKRNLIKVREVAPVVFSYRLDNVNNDRSSLREIRKNIEIERPHYEELDVDENLNRDEQLAQQEIFAQEQAEMDFIDKTPILPVDPKFKLTDDE
jgi:hypothetical protein